MEPNPEVAPLTQAEVESIREASLGWFGKDRDIKAVERIVAARVTAARDEARTSWQREIDADVAHVAASLGLPTEWTSHDADNPCRRSDCHEHMAHGHLARHAGDAPGPHDDHETKEAGR